MTLLLRLRRWFGGRGGGVVRRPRRRRRLEKVLRDEQATLRRWSQRASSDRYGP